MPERPDKEILELCSNDKTKEQGFRLLMQKYQEKVYWHIRRIVIDHEDANDVTQNVFIKIWNNLSGFRQESKLFSWIYRIATNEALSFLKSKKTNFFLPFGDMQSYLSSKLQQQDFIDCEEIQIKLQKALITLPKKQRLVFNMKYFDDLTYDEMSVILNTSIGALKASYHLAVKKIEKFIYDN